MEAFLGGIKQILLANPYTKKDNFHVVFHSYGSSSLDIMLYFFLEVPDWSEELIQKQNIFLEIMRLASSLEVDFAFPTQSLHVESFPEKQGLERHQGSLDPDALSAVSLSFGKGGSESQPQGLGLYKPPTQGPK